MRLVEFFQMTFLQRALAVGLIISLCAALLGVSLVLKRYSMIGDGLSHVGFGALAAAAGLNLAPLAVAIPVSIAAAFWLLRLNESGKLKGDAAVALISTGSLAVGITILSLTKQNADLQSYLFGSILAITSRDVVFTVVLGVVVVLMFVLFYHKIFAVTFDESFARATGTRTDIFSALIAALCALVVVVGMRVVGTLLMSSLIIFPALSAMRVCKRFLSVTIAAAGISSGCFVAGICFSCLIPVPSGAAVVLCNMAVFAVCWACGQGIGKE